MFGKRKQKWSTYHFCDISFQAPPHEAAAPPNHHRSSTTLGGETLIKSCMEQLHHCALTRPHYTPTCMILCPHKHDTMLSHARAAEGHQGRQGREEIEFRSEWERARELRREKNQRKHVQYVQSVRTPHNPSGHQPCAPFFTLHFHYLPLLESLRVLHESCS